MELIQAKGYGNYEEISRSLCSRTPKEVEDFSWKYIRPMLTGQ